MTWPSSAKPTPVTIITGFLGAGKTTLLNRLLHAPGLSDTAVIVNEFGEIGLDHLLVETGRDSVVLLDSGCLCCEIADSLRETLADLYQRRARGTVPPFVRVVIETSGLANPGPMLECLSRDPLLAGRFIPGSVICVVDTVFAPTSLASYREARDQVAFADWLVTTKGRTDPALRAMLERVNPIAPLIDADGDDFDPVALLESRLNWTSPDSHDHAHEADVGAHAMRLDRAVSWAGIAAWTSHLAARWGDALLRCKALLAVEGAAGPALIQGVRDRFVVTRLTEWPDADTGGRIVVIGRALERDALAAGLAWLDAPGGHPHQGNAGLPNWTEGTCP